MYYTTKWKKGKRKEEREREEAHVQDGHRREAPRPICPDGGGLISKEDQPFASARPRSFLPRFHRENYTIRVMRVDVGAYRRRPGTAKKSPATRVDSGSNSASVAVRVGTSWVAGGAGRGGGGGRVNRRNNGLFKF